jgi:hypothetical protein
VAELGGPGSVPGTRRWVEDKSHGPAPRESQTNRQWCYDALTGPSLPGDTAAEL